MRFILTALLWLLATAALAVALPGAWAQKNLVDVDGYAAFTEQAAGDEALQRAVAGELTTQLVRLGYTGDQDLLRDVASVYTAGADFPGQFAEANRFAHRWLFSDTIAAGEDPQGRWVVDLAPMLQDSSFSATLERFDISVPSTLPVPLTQNAPDSVRPGQLRAVATWGPWVSVGATILAGVLALLTLASARSRGKALAALGVSGLLIGAAGWAGLEVGQRYLDDALANTSNDVRQIADALIRHAADSMHQWLNIALAAGIGLVALGVLVAVLGGLRQRTVREPG
ncbi:hypothetical protein [[Mycobacterium] wendilense]|uniref:Uncharacterized protein n=1 Tax=[Mycobacterium] wendilense TaxID=3064284 RepID=A0ABM9MI18_9MYCO|nr:hypothetical protein [Mycolicibacterium sp. MU0050]CAJ1585712.1 hypothetical protein MU0050_003869 [Mycolicibacterium sp. MU0050]